MRLKLLAGFYASLLLLPFWANAQDSWQEEQPNGLVDWSHGFVEASGQGTSRYMGNRVQEELMAKQAARTTAQARLLETVKGVRLSGLSTLGTNASGDTRAASRIKGILQGATTVSEQVTWHKDETSRRGEVVMAEVVLRLCVSPTCQTSKTNLSTIILEEKPISPPAPTQAGQNDSLKTSAVIIDLEQALYLPALSPEIIDENEQNVYSQQTVAPSIAVEKGLIHYAKTVTKAKEMELSGPTPLIIPALRITKDNRIVLSNADGAKIRQLEALKQGRLIVALD